MKHANKHIMEVQSIALNLIVGLFLIGSIIAVLVATERQLGRQALINQEMVQL